MSKRGDVVRINFFGGLEDTASYFTSLREALDMGLQMGNRANSGLSPTKWVQSNTSEVKRYRPRQRP
ncbi:hypothetical protein [Mesorhizobium sp.]|uniref:hypothetical protein n=1 Tax=Mesorhizobium sp. TaxID=1871066 RepID=UPI0025B812FC|nr:hypothetical protein [Mesorhizobium sp.]